jgi:hypothetical protein
VCSPSCYANETCVAISESRSACQCSSGFYVSSPASGSVPQICTPCGAGTFSFDPNSQSCEICPLNTFSTVVGATSSSVCQDHFNCARGFQSANVPTASTDRICKQANACVDYPCSAFSSGCTDLAPPAPNSPSGRACGPCNNGYTSRGDACINNLLIVPVCHCSADGNWVTTGCNLNDSKPCPQGAGVQLRLCNEGNWMNPDTSMCTSLFTCVGEFK